MAGKRTATTQLDIYNLEDDEEPEQAEEFKRAPEEVIKNRVIKVAKRRNPIGSLAGSEPDKKNTFNNFTFGKSNTEAAKPTFSFLTNMNKEDEKKANSASSNQVTSSSDSNEYYAKLKGLNESVTKWIKEHVDANPFLNLTPIFKDYEQYLENIEKLKPSSNENNTLQLNKSEESIHLTEKTKTDLGGFSFKPTPTSTPQTDSTKSSNSTPSKSATESQQSGSSNLKKTPDKTGFSFGYPNAQSGTSPTTATASQAFSFGINNTQSTPSVSFGIPKSSSSSGFSFTNSTPFTFANVQSTETTNSSNSKEVKVAEEETETDQPPKNDFKPVIEEGHVYTIRCKVFVKKGDSFADRGVGNLFLKPISESNKTQLVVRADTNLGNVLLNFILSENIPFQRMGKKDVMGVALPTPDSKPPPIPILLRVKSPEEADNLLQQLEKYKK
ncbi:nuclear pore complex protein Nup50 [Agrilus planipennis]|uniref:Nuclear pore complex protein Nup50 n=1 Tax=Agrilus planipennis TaxID=224129 RepID=A0A1W4X533_AGRPL|nr:nuclear pore complex protein Nup50 [Agrilus planipennis]